MTLQYTVPDSFLVAKGGGIKEALDTVGTVEGYHAAALARELAAQHGIEMPITEQCYQVMYNNGSAKDAVKILMSRPHKDETEISWLK